MRNLLILLALAGAFMLPGTAPRAADDGIETHAVGLYQATHKRRPEPAELVVQVRVDRPGRTVRLILASYEAAAWDIRVAEGTTLEGVWISAYKPDDTHVFVDQYVYDDAVWPGREGRFHTLDGAGFRKAIGYWADLLGIERLASAQGAYDGPEEGFDVTEAPEDHRLWVDHLERLVRPDALTPGLAEIEAALDYQEGWRFGARGMGYWMDNRFLTFLRYADGSAGDSIGPRGSTAPVAAQDPETGLIYGVTSGGDSALYRFDPDTRALTPLGAFDDQFHAAAIAIDPAARHLVLTGFHRERDDCVIATLPLGGGELACSGIGRRDLPGYTDLRRDSSPAKLFPLAIADGRVLVYAVDNATPLRDTPSRHWVVALDTGTVDLVAFANTPALR
ncbi:MAG: hypothetical protein AAFV86_18055 [Pseudomonadota bacterium]